MNMKAKPSYSGRRIKRRALIPIGPPRKNVALIGEGVSLRAVTRDQAMKFLHRRLNGKTGECEYGHPDPCSDSPGGMCTLEIHRKFPELKSV